LTVITEDANSIPFSTFEGKKAPKGKTAMFVCKDFSCQSPVIKE
jgi:hypothetical protein